MAVQAKLLFILPLLLFSSWSVSYLFSIGEPDYVTIENPDSGKFSEDYKSYFVDADNAKNLDRWEWVYKIRWVKDQEEDKDQKKFNDKFKKDKVVKAYSTDTETSLNRVCKNAYKEDETTISDSSTNANYEANVWRYCSIGGSKPLTVKEAPGSSSYTENNLGKTKKDVLISTDTSKLDVNGWFWDLKDVEFYGLKGDEPLGEKEEDNSYFKVKYEENKSKSFSWDSVRVICEEAYKLEKSDTKSKDKPQESEVLKFCSLKGK